MIETSLDRHIFFSGMSASVFKVHLTFSLLYEEVLTTALPLPHSAKSGCATLVLLVSSFTPVRRRHFGVAVAIAIETPSEPRVSWHRMFIDPHGDPLQLLSTP